MSGSRKCQLHLSTSPVLGGWIGGLEVWLVGRARTIQPDASVEQQNAVKSARHPWTFHFFQIITGWLRSQPSVQTSASRSLAEVVSVLDDLTARNP